MKKNIGLSDIFMTLKTAYKGRKQIVSLEKKYLISENADYIVLLSTNNAKYNYYFLKGIYECFEPDKRVFILTVDDRIKKAAAIFEKRNELLVFSVSEEQANQLITYYSLTNFYWRFKLIDLDRPDDRKCSHVIGKKGITSEQLIACGIMDCSYERYINRLKRKKMPEYKGCDAEIISFFDEAREKIDQENELLQVK